MENTMNVNERIKTIRSQLHLSQEYVANYLGLNRSTYTQMENGNRKVTADSVRKAKHMTYEKLYADLRLNTQNSIYCKEENEAYLSIAGHYEMYQDIFTVLSLPLPGIRRDCKAK